MKRWFLLPLLAGLSMAADAPRTFTGVVHDNRCVGPECATFCPTTKEPVYTLQTADEAWVLSDPKRSAPYVGKKVTVTATPVIGNKLKVISIVAAR
jgi:hypothetical protein